jgi:ATP-binding cassette subfamily C protein LapB
MLDPAQSATEDEGPYDEQDVDFLLVCLKQVARLHGRPSSDVVLLAGLPLQEGRLTADLFIKAADRIGLSAERMSGEPDRITRADLPMLAWRVDGRPVVLTAIVEDTKLSVYVPERDAATLIPLDRARELLTQEWIRITPKVEQIDERGTAPGEPSGHWAWSSAKKYWRSYLHVILATVFVNTLALATPLFTMNVYDRVLANKAFATLWVLALGVFIAIAFDMILRSIRAFLIDYVARRMDLDISSLLIERILNTRVERCSANTGLVTQRLHEYEFVREFITSNTLVFFIDLAFTFIFLAVIFSISPFLIIVPLVAMVLMVVVGLLIQRLIGQELARADVTSAHRQSLMVEIVTGLETIKSVRAEGVLLRKWETVSDLSSNIIHKIKSYSALAANIAYFAQQLVSVSVIVVGVYIFDAGLITMGGIIAATMLASRTVAPLGQIALMLARARQAVSAFRAVDTIMSLPDERADRRLLVSRNVEHGRIEFQGVDFAYQPGTRKVLSGFSLKIAPGDRVAILGKVGAGKTTLGRLLIRLYEAQEGNLLIDGIDVKQYHPHELRKAVKFLGQDSDLFSGTLRENLIIAKPDATDKELINAARLAGVDDFAAKHPLGYEMAVGERGSLLSSGQRQMVGLARAFLEPGVVLYLDDPSSSMDMVTERLFIARLREALWPEQTLIVTTHRNAMLALVNRVVILDQGRVVADGPTDSVLRRLAEVQPQ